MYIGIRYQQKISKGIQYLKLLYVHKNSVQEKPLHWNSVPKKKSLGVVLITSFYWLFAAWNVKKEYNTCTQSLFVGDKQETLLGVVLITSFYWVFAA